MANSYKDIAKSTSIVASVQIVQMIFNLIKNKVISVVVGTAGFGIWSLYTTFFEMLGTVSMLGLDQSAVREIAKNSDDKHFTSKVFNSFKKVGIVTTAITSIIGIILSKQISVYLFNSESYRYGIIIVSVLLFFRTGSRIWYVIMNGLRYLKDLALSQIISTIAGTLITVMVVLLWGDESLAFAVGLVSIGLAIIPYFYVRKINLERVQVSFKSALIQSKDMLRLGLGFTIAGIVSTVMTFMGKSYLNSHFDIEDVGLYQASWTISNLYIGMILSAMGVDFMPRLSKVANDDARANEMINQQILFGVILGSIGVIGILLFSKIILWLVYSRGFFDASCIIRWHVLGVFLRLIAFPFGYAIMAKGKAASYAIIQVVFWVLEYLLLRLFGDTYGFDGLGVNYVVAYVVYLSCSSCLTVYYFKFRPTKNLIKNLIVICIGIVTSFIWGMFNEVNVWLYYSVSIIIFSIWIFYVNHLLKTKMDIDIISLVKEKL